MCKPSSGPGERAAPPSPARATSFEGRPGGRQRTRRVQQGASFHSGCIPPINLRAKCAAPFVRVKCGSRSQRQLSTRSSNSKRPRNTTQVLPRARSANASAARCTSASIVRARCVQPHRRTTRYRLEIAEIGHQPRDWPGRPCNSSVPAHVLNAGHRHDNPRHNSRTCSFLEWTLRCAAGSPGRRGRPCTGITRRADILHVQSGQTARLR